MKDLTAPKLQAVVESPEFLGICARLIEAMSLAKITKEKVMDYEVPIFKSLNFVTDKIHENPGTPINDPERAYLSDDDELFREFVVLAHKAHIENGFPLVPITKEEEDDYIFNDVHPSDPTFGVNPAKKAEFTQIQIENILLDFMSKEIGMPDLSYLEDRQKMLDLYLQMGSGHLKVKGDRVVATV